MSNFMQHCRWRLEVLAYDLACLLMLLFSFDKISNFGGRLIRRIGPRTSKQKIVDFGLRTAFPDADDAQIAKLSGDQWEQTGRTFAEFSILKRLKIYGPKSRVKVIGLDKLKKAHAGGKGFIVVTGHFANWEIMAAAIAQSGLPASITYRKINNPYFDNRVRAQRKSYGVELLVAKSGPKGAKELITTLKSGSGIAIMNDQKFNQGLSIPFFGLEANTAPGPTRLSLKTGAPLVPMCIRRIEGVKFEVEFYDPIELTPTGNRNIDIHNGTRLVTQFIENRIRENPKDWFWVHRRWDKKHYR